MATAKLFGLPDESPARRFVRRSVFPEHARIAHPYIHRGQGARRTSPTPRLELRPVAQLTEFVRAPARDGLVGEQRARVRAADPGPWRPRDGDGRTGCCWACCWDGRAAASKSSPQQPTVPSDSPAHEWDGPDANEVALTRPLWVDGVRNVEIGRCRCQVDRCRCGPSSALCRCRDARAAERGANWYLDRAGQPRHGDGLLNNGWLPVPSGRGRPLPSTGRLRLCRQRARARSRRPRAVTPPRHPPRARCACRAPPVSDSARSRCRPSRSRGVGEQRARVLAAGRDRYFSRSRRGHDVGTVDNVGAVAQLVFCVEPQHRRRRP